MFYIYSSKNDWDGPWDCANTHPAAVAIIAKELRETDLSKADFEIRDRFNQKLNFSIEEVNA